MRSRRPLTLVLVGPRPDSKVISLLSRYARVLPVGESADEEGLANWLAVLLPLMLPQLVEARGIDSLQGLRGATDANGHELIDLARISAEAVANRFIEMVEQSFQGSRDNDLPA